MGQLVKVMLGLIAALTVGCSNTPCSNVPLDRENLVAKSTVQESSPIEENSLSGPTVEVYKPTGELQCGGGKVLTLKDAEGQLLVQGIRTADGRTQSDKKIRMTVCGAANGQIHIFRIPAQQLKKAEKIGFRKWIDKGS
ncbi:MAG: hypothetical protein IT289_00340 [Oligoflexia bacterium]|nr:hypothetical protein [Oligoflexia bacterium]